MNKDMTEGVPSKILFAYSVSMLCSVLFQQLYNITDSIVAGQFIGESALASIGASFSVTMIFMAVAFGSNIGVSVIVSKLFGAKRFDRLRSAVLSAFVFLVALSVVLTVLGKVFSHTLLRVLKTPDDIIGDSRVYLDVYLYGLLFLFLYNIGTGVFTALGDSKTPLYFVICSSVGNVILDILFVVVFRWGVAGIAWATFLAQGVAAILSWLTLLKRLNRLGESKEKPHFSWRLLGEIGFIAVPSILQQSFVSVGNLLVQSLINGFGPATIAGFAAGLKLNVFALTSLTTLSNGLSNYVSQNLGGGKQERIKPGLKAGLIMSLIVSLPFTLTYLLFPDFMMRLFVYNISVDALAAGRTFLRVVSPFYGVICIKIMLDGVFKGAGAMGCFMVSTFVDLVIRVILAFVLVGILNTSLGIWLSWPVGWLLAVGLSIVLYKSGIWRRRFSVKDDRENFVNPPENP